MGGGGLVAKLCPILATPWTVAHQAPLSMGFSKQEYWSGYLCLLQGVFPDSGVEPRFPALQSDSLLTERNWELHTNENNTLFLPMHF